MNEFEHRLESLLRDHEKLIGLPNAPKSTNGVWTRYKNPVLTAAHVPIAWRYDLNARTNPFCMERIGVNSVFNAGAIRLDGKYLLVARIEGVDRKSYFAVAESDNGLDHFVFRGEPLEIYGPNDEETNVYDMRLTQHEDGWIYGIFCTERKDPAAPAGDTSSAVAGAGVVRSRDLVRWERLADIKSHFQQRNVVLHPEFVDGRYALYTRPQADFIEVGSGGGICMALVDDIRHAEITRETLVDARVYHTVKEAKNGLGPAPIKTPLGWLHLAHGVRSCACGLRYVLYLFLTALDDPARVVAAPGGYFMAPDADEITGDVSNVLFSNGWVVGDDGRVYIYYASSDSRMHVATSTVEKLLDYCLHTPEDGLTSRKSARTVREMIERNRRLMKQQ